MPGISEFFGLTIYMYWFDNQKHHIPHFHERYAGREALHDFQGNSIDGNVGVRANRLVKEWCDERRAELVNAWNCAIQGKEIPWITPLQ